MNKRCGRGSAFGKIILIGEHSVVYYKPALAIPFKGVRLDVEVCYKEGESILDCYDYNGLLSEAPDRYLGLVSSIKKVLENLKKDHHNLSIKVNSSIPIERGMGSSAAVTAATTRALYDYFNEELDDKVLSDFVNESEKIVHGNPSGIDTAIVVSNTPLYFIKSKKGVLESYNLDAYLIVADTGVLGNTKEAVSKVKDFINDNFDRGNFILTELEKHVNKSREYLHNNRLNDLAKSLNMAQKYLDELGVSSIENTRLVETALNEGALASKLTGGGLGGCIIALTRTEEDAKRISYKLEKQGAKQTWVMNMREV